MPSSSVNVKQFVEISKVSKQGVYKAGKAGRLNINKGQIDLSDQKTIDFLHAAKTRQNLEKEAENNDIEIEEDAVKNLPRKVQEAGGNGNGTSAKRKLEESRIEKQNRELDLKFRKARNELLERKDVQAVFSKLYSIQVTKLHGLSHMVTPEIAVIFESTDNAKMLKATDAIDGAVFSALEEIKKTMNEYLLSVETEEIENV